MSIASTGPLVEVYRLVADVFTLQASPVTATGISIQPQKNGPGSGSVTLNTDDPAVDDIDINDVIAVRRVELGDTTGPTIGVILVEQIQHHVLDAEEGVKRAVTYIGGLVGAFADWAVIAPALGDGAQPVEEDAVFDWRSPRYSAVAYGDTWSSATEIMTVTAAKAGAWPHQPMAEDFTTASGAYMICDASGDADSADMWWRLFYRDITVTTAGRYGIECLMDDLGKFWVDGIEQLDVRPEDGFVRASFKRLDLSAGTHRFCWAVYNFEDPDNPGEGLGPAALAYYLYKTDLQDHPLAGGDSWISDSNTKVMYVGAATNFPGMTVTDDLLQLVEEAQARGVFPWCVPTFTRDEDSNGDPMDRIVGLTTKTGTTTILAFLDELVAAGHISRWRWRPDGVTFDVFGPDYSTRPTSGAYPSGFTLEPADVTDPRTGQLIALDRVIT